MFPLYKILFPTLSILSGKTNSFKFVQPSKTLDSIFKILLVFLTYSRLLQFLKREYSKVVIRELAANSTVLRLEQFSKTDSQIETIFSGI